MKNKFDFNLGKTESLKSGIACCCLQIIRHKLIQSYHVLGIIFILFKLHSPLTQYVLLLPAFKWNLGGN